MLVRDKLTKRMLKQVEASKQNSKTMVIKINKPLAGYNVGAEVKIPCDDFGTPKNSYWRNRVRDSKIDNCIEIKESPNRAQEVKPKRKTSKKKTLKED